MIPRRPAQYLRKQFRWRIALVVGIWTGASALALLGFLRWWWPASFAAFPLLFLLRSRRFERGDLDPFPWFSGARGEEGVAKVLVGLEADGYRTLHDVETGHGNIDHVVVGPTGVFAIETKHWNGRFYPQGGRLMHSGRDNMEIVKQATKAAMEVKRRLAVTGVNVWVEALVVSTKAEVLGKPLTLGYVTVLESADLPAFLRNPRRRTLSSQEVARCVAAVLRGHEPVTVRSISYD